MTADQYRALRRRIGTQKHVAHLLGIHRVTIAKRETSALPIEPEAALAIRALAASFPQRARGS